MSTRTTSTRSSTGTRSQGRDRRPPAPALKIPEDPHVTPLSPPNVPAERPRRDHRGSSTRLRRRGIVTCGALRIRCSAAPTPTRSLHTLARTFRDLGYAAVRPNFRGVGEARANTTTALPETEDLLAVLGVGAVALGRCRSESAVFLWRLRAPGRPPRNVHRHPRRMVLVGFASGEVMARAATPPNRYRHTARHPRRTGRNGGPRQCARLGARPQSLPVVVAWRGPFLPRQAQYHPRHAAKLASRTARPDRSLPPCAVPVRRVSLPPSDYRSFPGPAR